MEHSCDASIPHHTAVVGSSDHQSAVELCADAVRVFTEDDATAQLAVVVEIQRRCDQDKYWVWPVLPAHARRLHKCDAALLTAVPDDTTAAWSY